MRYIVVPAYDDDQLARLVLALPTDDFHVLSDTDDIGEVLAACMPSTTSIDEQLVLAINQELAMATALACAERAKAQWG